MTEGSGLVCPAGYTAVHLEAVGSTNAEAFERGRQGAASGLWVVARRQTEGRGRRGRVWTSEPGNLYASLMLRDPMEEARLGELPLVVALAVHDAIAAALPPFARADLAIKWPNDILVDGRKINGILLESESLPGGRMAVVVGCGINCRHHPENPAYPATDLADCGIDMEPEAMFPVLAREMATTLVQWNRGTGFDVVREAWLRAARGIGETVTINLHEGQVTGVFEDIDVDGYLCLLTENETRRRISAGDLFFTQPAGPVQ